MTFDLFYVHYSSNVTASYLLRQVFQSNVADFNRVFIVYFN